MENKVIKKRKAFVFKEECVSCGSCVKVCPVSAIQVIMGLYADVDHNKCVGCKRCAVECPASVIEIKEVIYEKEKALV